MINRVKRTIKERVSDRLNLTFSGKPWHGKSLKDILNTSSKPLPPRALELVNHMIAWRLFVVDTLNGKERSIDLNSSEDWPPANQSWTAIIEELEASHTQLLEAIQNFDEGKWHTKPEGAQYTYLQLCHGIIDHDIYHSGQIAVAIRQAS